jgi:hypothetical protein
LNNVHIPPERGHSLAARVAFCAQHPRKPHGAVKDKGLPKQVDHELCTKAIRKLDPDVWHETNALPMEVVTLLDQGMPKNGLLEWCKQNPNIVEVMYTGEVSKKKKENRCSRSSPFALTANGAEMFSNDLCRVSLEQRTVLLLRMPHGCMSNDLLPGSVVGHQSLIAVW